ncbi:MAG: MBL fold metallo-hydrolase [Acidimicrobiia bacterium]|nr:MBL fold metallo-hydrolase [Acidimicrobiia bacterium]
MMDIVLTGTGSPLPDANRAGPSTLVKAGETHILVDAGRGVVMRMAGAGSLPVFLSAVLITHLHSDHVCDLNDVITTHWIMSQGAGTLAVYGPRGTAEFIQRQMSALEADIGYRIEHHAPLTEGPRVDVTELEVTGPRDVDGEPEPAFTVGDVSVSVAATEHAPARPTIGYRLEHGGVAAALVGDTLPCAGVDTLASGVDGYVQTVIRRDLVEAIPNEMMQDILDYHSSVIDAARTAARVGAKRLVLTHMVPPPTPEDYPEWRRVAAEHFAGEVIIGDDLTTITLRPT